MLRFVVFVVVLVAVCGVFIPGDTQSVKIFDNADRYDTELDDTLQNISYTFGKRVDGDRLVQSTDWGYEGKGSSTTVLRYPPIGENGSIVSFVEIFIRQTNNLSTARIFEGGIGQRNIVIHVTAKNITSFSHFTNFYGHD